MPVKRCQRNGEKGWRWGKTGKCYIPSEEGSDEDAKKRAEEQGRAIESRRKKNAFLSICQKAVERFHSLYRK